MQVGSLKLCFFTCLHQKGLEYCNSDGKRLLDISRLKHWMMVNASSMGCSRLSLQWVVLKSASSCFTRDSKNSRSFMSSCSRYCRLVCWQSDIMLQQLRVFSTKFDCHSFTYNTEHLTSDNWAFIRIPACIHVYTARSQIRCHCWRNAADAWSAEIAKFLAVKLL